eukprot:TRINITY_DN5475_c0_g1_i2.p1 TRINITY_DN5475_c0_g1~~TRINITY_DN5475_c0_g1_i2.p1  ORF type:complete len:241 (+),score=36.45 TRINITY_DN5475_c0_g1_i2:152-874(+)
MLADRGYPRDQSLKMDKFVGRIPRGNESPFGDFPPDYSRPSKLSMLGSSMVRHAKSVPDLDLNAAARGMGPKTIPLPLKKGSGTGGTISSIVSKKLPMRASPPKAGALSRRNIAPSEFRRAYDRGDVPVQISYAGTGKQVAWKVDVEKLDYIHYLPMFFDGLREKEDPYRLLAVQGLQCLIEQGGTKLLPTVPQLILPMKAALNTRDPEVIATVLKILQQMVLSGPMVGEALDAWKDELK